MSSKSILILLVCTFLFGCTTSNREYQIIGKLPSNQYDGRIIYLVPLDSDSSQKVDSTVIENGRFFFKGQGSGQMVVLRAHLGIRLFLQELLVLTEPGTIEVCLDTISSASGTSLNDSLQKWKEAKEEFDKEQTTLSQKLRKAESDSEREQIKEKQKELKQKATTFNYNFIKANRENFIGEFIYRMTKSLYVDEQIEELKME